MNNSLWMNVGVFIGIFQRCPGCGHAQRPNEIMKIAKSRKIRKSEEPNSLYGSHSEITMHIVWVHTFKCTHCEHHWNAETEEELEDFEFEADLTSEERRKYQKLEDNE